MFHSKIAGNTYGKTQNKSSPQNINKSFSIYLDAMRFFAAMIVLCSHWSYPRFTDGYYLKIRELNLGSDAVVLFFVLSGLVIAYTTDVKDKTLKLYSWHRLSRLYSVIIIALITTILLDTIGATFYPENYDGWWHNKSPIWQQLLYGLTFSNEFISQGFRIGTNGPLWSLSYEVIYYALFGVAFYLRGLTRVTILSLLTCVAGINILLLFPTWLIGLGVYYLIKNSQKINPILAFVACIISPILYIIFLAINLPDYLFHISEQMLSIDTVKSLRFSNEFIWNNLIATLIATHLIGIYALTQHPKNWIINSIVAKKIHWCAGASFSIYVIHYPALQFLDALLPEDITPIIRHILLFSLCLCFCFSIAELSERRLNWLRKKILKQVSIRNFLY